MIKILIDRSNTNQSGSFINCIDLRALSIQFFSFFISFLFRFIIIIVDDQSGDNQLIKGIKGGKITKMQQLNVLNVSFELNVII